MTEGFTPISPNPYIVGNPVRGRKMFFGREAEFSLVHKRFGHTDHGGLLVFCGERRSGKTSILFQILDKRLGPDFIPVLIDMQSMAVGGEVEFLTRLSEEILGALGAGARGIALPDFSGDGNRAALFERFVKDCLHAHPGKKLILLFDEYELFENKIDAGLLAEDVLFILAALMERASVFMIFTGSQHLEQRRREYWKVLGKSLYKTVSYLEREDAVNLVRQPVEGRVHFEDDAVERILRMSAGQAFYTQAICQSLVDQINERQSADVGVGLVDEVVDGIINNPLPQMIFMWDGLERNDKLVLALLAERLEDGTAFASVDDMLRHLRKRDYPLELDRADAATTAEKLYKSEMLLRSDEGTEPAYAFRMDLWRLWIRRQHSVWQVIREEKLEIRRRPKRRLQIITAAAALAVVVAVVVVASTIGRRGSDGTGLAPDAPRGFLVLEADPQETTIRLGGRVVGMGALHDPILAGADQELALAAEGYADTTVIARVAQGDTLSMQVAMRPLLGDLAIETTPPGAVVRLDGRDAGRSPLTLRSLPVPGTRRIEVSHPGYGTARRDVALDPGATVRVALVLEQGRSDVVVTTDPAGSDIQLDGAARGASPVTLAGTPLGRHRLRAVRSGYVPADTTVEVAADTRQVHLVLAREAPGVLVVRGDLPVQIYVDGVLVVENVPNSGPQRLAPGSHDVKVITVSGETIDRTLNVRSGERIVFDFSNNSVSRTSEGGSSP